MYTSTGSRARCRFRNPLPPLPFGKRPDRYPLLLLRKVFPLLRLPRGGRLRQYCRLANRAILPKSNFMRVVRNRISHPGIPRLRFCLSALLSRIQSRLQPPSAFVFRSLNPLAVCRCCNTLAGSLFSYDFRSA